MGVKELSDAGPDGTRLGQSSTDEIGFYGATPVVRPTTPTAPVSTAITAVSVSPSVSVTATQWAYASSAQANAIITAVNDLILRSATNVAATITIKSNLDTLGLQG